MGKKPTEPTADKPVETASEQDKGRVFPLRTFRVEYVDRPDEYVTAHNMLFPHPREATFVDIIVQDNMVLQYTRKAVFNWNTITETTAGVGTTAVM